MSAKWRLITWFTGMMLALTAFILVVIFVINDAAITGDPQSSIIEVVEDNAVRLEEDAKKGYSEIDWGSIKYYKHGVYSVVYTGAGKHLRGGFPVGVSVELPFEDTEIREVECLGEPYYVYDVSLTTEGKSYWIRGVIATTSASHVMRVFIILLWAIVPTLLAFSVGGGWLIAWGAFRPMEKIIKAANSISDGDDLSRRIGLKRGAHEMRRLGKTFDNMFDRLEKSFNTQKQFASDASHELRTPVTVIKAECDRALRRDKTPEDYRESIIEIKDQADRMAELIEQLLSLTRLQFGAEKFPLTLIDLSTFTASVCEEFVPGEDRGIKIALNIEEGIYANCNMALMAACINNLLQNANKYGNDGGHTIVTLKKSVESYATLSVEDDGIGIAPENLDKVWNRFWQADGSRGTAYGSGLGLSLVKETMKLHGGWVELESEPGRGSRFSLVLPTVKEPQE